MTMTAVESPRRAASRGVATPAWQDDFVTLLPAIERRLRFSFRGLSREAREEAVQEATCLACRAYARLAAAGRAGVATAASLAGYAAAQYRAGRRAASPLNVRDVCSDHCRLRKGVAVERLCREGGGGRELLVEDRTVTPAELAASRLDYAAFLAGLPGRLREAAELLASGETTCEAAAALGVSAGRVSQLRRELRESWSRLHGEASPVGAVA